MARKLDGMSMLETSNEIEDRMIDAFMTLYGEKPIEKISIQSITDLAGLSRGTFYLHYLDIYDLLEKIEGRYHAVSKSIARNVVEPLLNKKLLETVLPSKEFYDANLKYYKILLCGDNKSRLPELIKKELKAVYKAKYKTSLNSNDKMTEYMLEFITSA